MPCYRYSWMTYGEAGTSRSAIGSGLLRRQIQRARLAPNSLWFVVPLNFCFIWFPSCCYFCTHRDLVLGCILLTGPSGLSLIMPALRILLFLYLYMTHLVSDQSIIVSLSFREAYNYAKCEVFICVPSRSKSSWIHCQSCICTSYILRSKNIEHCEYKSWFSKRSSVVIKFFRKKFGLIMKNVVPLVGQLQFVFIK